MRRRRGLTPEDRDLWSRVARTAEPLDPKRKRRQQHHGSQRIKAGDTEGEGRSEERQHRQRLLGSHLTDGRTDRSVAQ